MTRKDKILEFTASETLKIIDSNKIDDKGIETKQISDSLFLDRANTSKELNRLWKEGKLIKIQTKPVLYLNTSEILKAYSLKEIPSSISKNEKISDYIFPNVEHISKNTNGVDKINLMIGAENSLSSQISAAKTAIAYPPYGLHMLISGEIGVGKHQFVTQLFEYAKKHDFKPLNANIVKIDCQFFQNQNDQFFLNLLGAARGYKGSDKTIKGAIDKAEGGIVYLDTIHRLNPSFVEKLSYILETSSYSRLGENVERKLNCTIIASTNSLSNSDEVLIQTIRKYFPTYITLPNLNQYNAHEKIEHILATFSNEAKNINRAIRFNKDVLYCFLIHQYKENLYELNNEVKNCCSRTYLDAKNKQLEVLTISYQHLSSSFLGQNTSQLHEYESRVLASIPDNYIFIDSNGNCKQREFIHNALESYNLIRVNQFVNIFNADFNTINEIRNHISESIMVLNNCGNIQLQAIYDTINPYSIQLLKKNIHNTETIKNFENHFNSFYGILLNLTEVIKQIENGTYTYDKNYYSFANKVYVNEYKDAKDIIDELSNLYKINIDAKEVDFIATYFAITNSWFSSIKPGIMIISHGENIASSMFEYVTPLLNNIKACAIDFKDGMILSDILEYASIKANEIDQGAGLIIVADYEPLLNVSEFLKLNYSKESKTIPNLSLKKILTVISLINSNLSINEISTYFDNKEMENNAKKINDNFINELVEKYIKKTVDFIDVYKATDCLKISLDNICAVLQIEEDKKIIVKFLCHCIHMLGRVIRNEPFEYPQINNFIKSNQKIYRIIEKNFININESFGITIPKDEYCYITEIFLDL